MVAESKDVHPACARCGGWLKADGDKYGDYRICLMCGWTKDIPRPQRKEALWYAVRYSGEDRKWADVVLIVSLGQTSKLSEGYVPRCPWCDTQMDEVSLSRKRKWKRYACAEGHRISLYEHGDRLSWA